MPGPQSPFSDALHAEKYRSKGENFREAMNRVASTLTESDREYQAFREVIQEQRYLPAGRIQSAVGSTKNVTPYNCYVSGTIEDSFVEGAGSIMSRAHEAAATMRMGGGIGYDFSTLRPSGALIKKLQSRSSGPINFMKIFNEICKCVASSGHRRGAQMGVMRVDHPDIEEFIYAKQDQHSLTGFNMSIAVTDEFMECVEYGRPFALRFGKEVYKEIDAEALWETIMRSTWDWAEPGVLFIDQINRQNNLRYCETIAATNPCGEQPLPPHGACLLGSFNLVKYVLPFTFGIDDRVAKICNQPAVSFDWNLFSEDIHKVVPAMDMVVDHATYPLYEQEKEAKNKRRMGIGVTGLANALEVMGLPYGSDGFVEMEERILKTLANETYYASAMLARKRGAFPLYDEKRYLDSEFVKRQLDPGVIEAIKENGIRNSHLTSIAPTGTISMCADNVSSGIEPVFAYSTQRTYIGQDGPEIVELEDYAFSRLGIEGKKCEEVTIDEHLNVLIAASRSVDSAVSKTCNVPSHMPWSDFKHIYTRAWEAGCKGCTTYRVGGKRGAILKDMGSEEDKETEQPKTACYLDEATGRRECE